MFEVRKLIKNKLRLARVDSRKKSTLLFSSRNQTYFQAVIINNNKAILPGLPHQHKSAVINEEPWKIKQRTALKIVKLSKLNKNTIYMSVKKLKTPI